MESKNSIGVAPISIQWLKYLSRISAWLLLVAVVVLVVSGWGITHTEIIYKATFGLIDRRLANSIHRATNIPLAVFFLSHVLINVRLIVCRKNPNRIWLIDAILITVGLIMITIFLYVEYWA
jgi:hypothetical protein